MSMMEPNLPRPESALARGIKITEFSGVRVNPEPVTYEESDILLEEYLSPYRLVGRHSFDSDPIVPLEIVHRFINFNYMYAY